MSRFCINFQSPDLTESSMVVDLASQAVEAIRNVEPPAIVQWVEDGDRNLRWKGKAAVADFVRQYSR